MKRRKQIEQFFQVFALAKRNQLARLFFSDRSDPFLKCTQEMQKYRQEGWITAKRVDEGPFVYYRKPMPPGMKYISSKMEHYFAIVDAYIELVELGIPFEVKRPEIPFGKKYPTVDLIVNLWDRWIFTEIQRTKIDHKRMQKKIEGYERLYVDGIHQEICHEFIVGILSQDPYKIETKLPTIQAATMMELVDLSKDFQYKEEKDEMNIFD